jgi:hypothetical protein
MADMDTDWLENVEDQADELRKLADGERNPGLRIAVLAAHRKLLFQLREYVSGAGKVRRFELKAEECRTIAEWCVEPAAAASYKNLAGLYERMAANARRNVGKV